MDNLSEKDIRFYDLWKLFKKQGASVSMKEWVRLELSLSPEQIQAMNRINTTIRNTVEDEQKATEMIQREV